MRNRRERRRKRILILPAWYPWYDRPGLGSFCRDQALATSRIHDVIVVTWRSDESLTVPFAVSETDDEGVRTFRIRVRPRPQPRLETLGTVLAVVSILARLGRRRWIADVVHAHEYLAGFPALMASSVLRAPLVVSEHYSGLALGMLPEDELVRARRIFNRAAVVCPASHDLGRRIRPLTGDTPIMPISNPIDDHLFTPGKRAPGETLRLLAVGNLVPIKGHSDLIDALPSVAREDCAVSLDIVGDGELRQALEDQARERGVDTRVRFHGFLPKQEVASMMRAADLLVLPSRWENLPCVLLEAMASGLPVVATRVGGTSEIVDASCGELVPPGSADALAAAILRVAHAKGTYDPARMHATAKSRYGYDAVASTLTKVYERALER